MGSTNKTAHYELPQFVANDKPSWLGDVNEAMEAIDTGIYGAKASADGAQQTANNAVAGVQSAGTRMDGMQTQLDTVATQANQTATTVAGHTSSIATNSANINTLNSRMGSTDISAIGDGTVTGAIDALAQGGGGGGVVNWTEVDSISHTGTSGNQSKTVTADISSYKEFLLRLKDEYGMILGSTILKPTDASGACYATVATGASAILLSVQANFVKASGTLKVTINYVGASATYTAELLAR